MKSQPVFIVAPVRSGSTLFRLMLDSHPEITNPSESDFLFDILNDDQDFPSKEEYLEWLSVNRIFQATGLNVDNSLSYKELLDSFITQMHTSEILTINIHRNFHLIPKVFPNARYIHLTRDPRDVARSCIGMGWVGHVYYGVDTWVKSEKSWDKLKSQLNAEQYIELQYEQLLSDLEVNLSKICEFLGVSYTDKMLDYAKTSSYELPNKSLCYQWKEKYSQREIQLVEGKVSDMLIERGYKLSNLALIRPNNFEKLELKIKNSIFRWRFSIKRYGLSLFLQSYVARKLNITKWVKLNKIKVNEIDTRYLK